MLFSALVVALGTLCLISNRQQHAQAREVIVDLTAPWASSHLDYLIEVSEFLATVPVDGTENSPYWRFHDQLCAQYSTSIDELASLKNGSRSSVRSDVLATAQAIVPPMFHPLLNVFVGVKTYAPKVAFFHSLSAPFGRYAMSVHSHCKKRSRRNTYSD